MDERFPAPVYADTVLAQNFADAKRYFSQALLEIHHAHARMLAKQGILSADDTARLIDALRRLDSQKIAEARYDGTHEDFFFFIEAMLEEAAGKDLAGKLHTARSRNDIAITLYRMTARREILALMGDLLRWRAALIDLASTHRNTVMPAHTHTQPAQPTTLAHYLLAVIEVLGRDAARLRASFANVNMSPMGAAAITTTGFPIDRDETALLLGFEGLAQNSYAAIASIDYITEAAAAVAVAMVNLGKSTQDLLLWSTREFGYLRLSDGYVQTSSIMPQKRNPVALEHARILGSRAFGEAQAVLTCAHNTPFGDINDSEDDLQPLVFTMFSLARRAVELLAGVMRSVTFDVNRMKERAGQDFLTVTELADALVRDGGLSFREAHRAVSDAVKACSSDGPDAVFEALVATYPPLTLTREQVRRALDPVHFVQIRGITGGPAPERTSEALEAAQNEQERLAEWRRKKAEALDRARRELLG